MQCRGLLKIVWEDQATNAVNIVILHNRTVNVKLYIQAQKEGPDAEAFFSNVRIESMQSGITESGYQHPAVHAKAWYGHRRCRVLRP